jgi:hypothetical protein
MYSFLFVPANPDAVGGETLCDTQLHCAAAGQNFVQMGILFCFNWLNHHLRWLVRLG